MACVTDHYDFLANSIGTWIGDGVDLFTPYFGRPLAMAAVAVLMSPLTLLLIYVTRVLIPDFVKWYYDETINQKAREYWRRKCIGTGMTIPGAKLSIALGFVFFFLVRLVVSLPAYYPVSLPAFVLAFVGVAIVGFFVGGNVPDNAKARNKYFRRFHAPTVTGVGLGLFTIALEFVFQASTLALSHMHSV